MNGNGVNFLLDDMWNLNWHQNFHRNRNFDDFLNWYFNIFNFLHLFVVMLVNNLNWNFEWTNMMLLAKWCKNKIMKNLQIDMFKSKSYCPSSYPPGNGDAFNKATRHANNAI